MTAPPPSSFVPQFEPGALLAGKYRVERLLGKGGMGAVYAAQHELLAQRVAVKLLLTALSGNPEGLQRFLNEARAAARLDSEHVARVMDVGTLESGQPYMVLEYLEGSYLSQLLTARGPLPLPEVVDYVLQTCEALAQAHAAGIVHRDLKPSNLYLARRHDGTSRIKVLDFGISKVSDQGMTPQALTSTSAMLGTPYYMSPEQFVAPRSVDYRTDLWALGVILGELLIGEPPFNGETLGQLMYNIMSAPLPNLAARRPDLPPPFIAVVQRCMERDPARRPANVAELARALAPFGTGAQNQLLERMARSLGVHGGPPPAAMGSGPAVGPNTIGGVLATPFPGAPYNTAASWGQASAPGGAAGRSKAVPFAVGAGLLVVAAVAGGAFLVLRAPGRSAAGSASASVPAPASVAGALPPAPATASATATQAAPPVPSPPATRPAVAPPPRAPAKPARPSDQLPDNSRQ